MALRSRVEAGHAARTMFQIESRLSGSCALTPPGRPMRGAERAPGGLDPARWGVGPEPTASPEAAATEEATDGEREPIQALREGGATTPAAPPVDGDAHPRGVMRAMESAFGADFSDIRLHLGSLDPGTLGAVAFTRGQDVHVSPGASDSRSPQHRAVIGHELAHVVQQRAGRVPDAPAGREILFDARLEAEADAAGQVAARGGRVVMPWLDAGRRPRGGSPGARRILGFWDMIAKEVLREVLRRGVGHAGGAVLEQEFKSRTPQMLGAARAEMQKALDSAPVKDAIQKAGAQINQLDLLQRLAAPAISQAVDAAVAKMWAMLDAEIEKARASFPDLMPAQIEEARALARARLDALMQQASVLDDLYHAAVDGMVQGVSSLVSQQVMETMRSWAHNQAVEAAKAAASEAKSAFQSTVTAIVADYKSDMKTVGDALLDGKAKVEQVVDAIPSVPWPGRKMVRKQMQKAGDMLVGDGGLEKTIEQVKTGMQDAERMLGAEEQKQLQSVVERAQASGDKGLLQHLDKALTVITYLDLAGDVAKRQTAREKLRALLLAGAGYVGSGAGSIGGAVAGTVAAGPVGTVIATGVASSVGSAGMTKAAEAILDLVPVEDAVLAVGELIGKTPVLGDAAQACLNLASSSGELWNSARSSVVYYGGQAVSGASALLNAPINFVSSLFSSSPSPSAAAPVERPDQKARPMPPPSPHPRRMHPHALRLDDDMLDRFGR